MQFVTGWVLKLVSYELDSFRRMVAPKFNQLKFDKVRRIRLEWPISKLREKGQHGVTDKKMRESLSVRARRIVTPAFLNLVNSWCAEELH